MKIANELIARFMGYTYYPYNKAEQGKGLAFGWMKGDKIRKLPEKLLYSQKNFLARTTKDLHFHDDWNRLMDVVDYIENNLHHYQVEIERQDCIISEGTTQGDGGRYYKVLVNTDGATKIESVYKAVMEFILEHYKE